MTKDGVDGLLERLWRALPRGQQERLGDFARKFYAVPYAVKDYHGFDDILDTCIQCLVFQHRLRIDYRGLVGEGKVHEFDPYTLTTYRGGLYLIGYSQRFKKIIWLAVERIAGVEKLSTTFEYPKRYSPQKHTKGIFGIIDGPETRVELVLRNTDTAAYVEVLKPRALREEVQESLAEAMRVYVGHAELACSVPLAAGRARTRVRA